MLSNGRVSNSLYCCYQMYQQVLKHTEFRRARHEQHDAEELVTFILSRIDEELAGMLLCIVAGLAFRLLGHVASGGSERSPVEADEWSEAGSNNRVVAVTSVGFGKSLLAKHYPHPCAHSTVAQQMVGRVKALLLMPCKVSIVPHCTLRVKSRGTLGSRSLSCRWRCRYGPSECMHANLAFTLPVGNAHHDTRASFG
jgi:hypothetical protein